MSDFDFDTWRELAVRDPERYFRERQRTIDSFIAEHPASSASLRELQTQIDRIRALSGSPLNAARELARLLGKQLDALAHHLTELNVRTAQLDAVMRRAGY